MSLQLTADDLQGLRLQSGMLNDQSVLDADHDRDHDDDGGFVPIEGDVDADAIKTDVAAFHQQHDIAYVSLTQHGSSSQQRRKRQSGQELQIQRESSTVWRTLGAFQVVSKFPIPSKPQSNKK